MMSIRSPRPPRLCRRLLLRFLPEHAREPLIGDLDEEFIRYRRPRGALTARAWYWFQAIRTVIAVSRRDRQRTPRRSFGGVLRLLIDDARSGVRLLRNQPAFSTVAVLTLAVGIGLSTTLFTVIHAAVLRPFPIADAERLVRIDVRFSQPDGETIRTTPSLQDVRDWRAAASALSHIAMDRDNRAQVVEAGDAERVTVRWISEGYLELFEIRPQIGRAITIDDAHESSPAVVLLGHGYWQSRFGGDRGVVGRDIRIDNKPFTIIGVIPATFNPQVALWQPLRYAPDFERRRGTGAPVVGRLKPGVSATDAVQELSRIASMTVAGTEVVFASVFAETVESAATSARTLAGAVGAILLMACVNVSGLLLARGASRRRELAVRASLGASRSRLVRQLLMESLVLALAGGAAGVLLAWLSKDALLTIIPITVPETAMATLNAQVLSFSAVLAIATVLVFGVLPAIRLSRVDVSVALAGADRHSGAALSRRSGQVLIAVEVALAVVVLAGAALMVRSFSKLVSVDLGFDPSAFVTLEAAPVDPSPAVAATYYPALVERVRQLPGVLVAGASTQLPIGGSRRAGSIPGPDGKPMRVDHRLVLPGYFEAVGMTVKDGRLLADADLRGAAPVLVINDTAAKKLFPGARAVGQHVRLNDQSYEIVGVIADVLQDGARSPVRPNVYAVYTGRESFGRSGFPVFVRPAPGASNLAAQLREAALSIGPKAVVDRIQPGSAFVAEEMTMPRRRMQLLGLVGTVGLALTLVGIFSVTSFTVVRRTREIGVRMALGARPASAVGAIMRDAAGPIAIGLAAGLTGAYFLTRVMVTFLFDTAPQDPVAFAMTALLLAIAAVIATWWPARHAAKIDPVAALRADA